MESVHTSARSHTQWSSCSVMPAFGLTPSLPVGKLIMIPVELQQTDVQSMGDLTRKLVCLSMQQEHLQQASAGFFCCITGLAELMHCRTSAHACTPLTYAWSALQSCVPPGTIAIMSRCSNVCLISIAIGCALSVLQFYVPDQHCNYVCLSAPQLCRPDQHCSYVYLVNCCSSSSISAIMVSFCCLATHEFIPLLRNLLCPETAAMILHRLTDWSWGGTTLLPHLKTLNILVLTS